MKAMGGSSLALVLSMTCSSCNFSARIGDARVTMSDDEPCFSVEQSWETKGGIPLYGIVVNAQQSNGSFEEALRWRIAHKPDAPQAKTSPNSCIQYGTTPNGFELLGHKPLEPYAVYNVMIDAKPERSWRKTFTYAALFCLTRNQSGKLTVHDISRDNSLGPSRFDVCRKRE